MSPMLFTAALIASNSKLGSGDTTEEVPAVSLKVEKNRYLTVRLHTWFRDERNTRSNHPSVGSLEVVDSQEEADSARELLANNLCLRVAICARKQNARRTAGRANYDPTFGTTIVRQRRNVLN